MGVISSWLTQLPGQEVQYFPIHGCRNWQLGKKHEPTICRDLYKFLKDNIPLGILKHPGPQSWQWKMLLFLMRNRSRFPWIEIKRSEPISTGMFAMLDNQRVPVPITT